MMEKLQTRGGEDDVLDVEQHVSSVGATTVDVQEPWRRSRESLGLGRAQKRYLCDYASWL
jgi:hypothetical protein